LQQKEKSSGVGKPVQKFPIRFVAAEHFWISLQYRGRIFSLKVKEFDLFY
jgi:hypothetical protein